MQTAVKFSASIFLLLFLFGADHEADAGTYWVSPEGQASWKRAQSQTPLTGKNACSLRVACSQAKAGDTVYLRAGTYSGQAIRPENSGESEQRRLAFASHKGESVVFEESEGIYLFEKSFVSVTGIQFRQMLSFLRIYGGHHNIISHCNFDGRSERSKEWAGGLIVNGPYDRSGVAKNSTHNWVHHCRFYRWVYRGDLPNRGALLDIGEPVNRDPAKQDESTHNRVEHCHFAYGGHHTLGVFSRFNVIRFNYIHNETNPKNWQFPGYRGAITQGMAGGRSLWEGNRFGFSDHKGLDVRTPLNIVRFNQFYRHGYGGIQVATNLEGIDRADENHFYHNTFYRNGHRVENPGFQGGIYFANWMKSGPTGVSPQRNVVKNNLFYHNKNGSVVTSEGLIVPQTIEGNWDDGDGDPQFADLGNKGPDTGSLPDLRLGSASPVKDRGAWLTTITSRDGHTSTFTVEDSNYFMDGWGIVPGDRIQLAGQDDRVTVTKVDYATHTLTVDAPLTFKRGQGVALAYAGKAPDPGAHEGRQPE